MAQKDQKETRAPRKTIGEQMDEARKKAIENRVILEGLGIDLNPRSEREVPLATQIVLKAMDMQEKATARLEAEVKEGRQSAADYHYHILGEQLERIQEAQNRVDAMAKEALASRTSMDSKRMIVEQLSELVAAIGSGLALPRKEGMSDETQIRLKELELEQARVLAQITADSAREKQQLDLLVAVFRQYQEIARMTLVDLNGRVTRIEEHGKK